MPDARSHDWRPGPLISPSAVWMKSILLHWDKTAPFAITRGGKDEVCVGKAPPPTWSREPWSGGARHDATLPHNNTAFGRAPRPGRNHSSMTAFKRDVGAETTPRRCRSLRLTRVQGWSERARTAVRRLTLQLVNVTSVETQVMAGLEINAK